MANSIQWEERDRLTISISWNGERFIARCREYDLWATGKTLNEARDALWAMIQHYQALTDIEAWNDYFASVQEEFEEEANNRWTSGEHVIN